MLTEYSLWRKFGGGCTARSCCRLWGSSPDIDVANFTVILRKVYSMGPPDPVSCRWSPFSVNLIFNPVYNYTWQAIFMCWVPLARFLSTVSRGLNSTTRLAYRLNSPRKHSASWLPFPRSGMCRPANLHSGLVRCRKSTNKKLLPSNANIGGLLFVSVIRFVRAFYAFSFLFALHLIQGRHYVRAKW